ncbi:hypothetical protein N7499_012028 [Penicillium canescens]|uniref:Uncharacterized protein n=1 Tax=Penicillium canescens TaxID=5083 RepID=A0AAD6ILV9_PENCN|nr:uncharacterized protein N7446_007298 [Penicillium canescens]KAJ5991371.1 hypothetical protein N7522_011578 [Penicillium canescens]KAJ6049372.1 hypothetical protein N7444_006088 [Penicillium canescens]KAJ6052658.1 hypothetical protein N7460_003192 [Penicillium canescens]KAJ6063178.1 hypothetical protein N7446_007298 [Penicillium canescens]KAJ6070141.1 hypothetical protein N7499_012028 [Penicillium canescens]
MSQYGLTPESGQYITAIDQDEVPRLCNIIHAGNLFELETMPRYQDIDPRAFEWREPPACILFISHRWETPTHPDADGKQLKAIIFLMQAIVKLASVCKLPLEQRTAVVKTLKVHGYLQAANIVRRVADNTGGVNRSILDKIGVWLDYMWIDDRTPANKLLFKEGLRRLPSLVASCDFILSIRSRGDDYIQRAWCISELCFMNWKCHKNSIVLRQDLLNEPIDARILNSESSKPNYLLSYRSMIETWENESRFTWNPNMSFYYAEIRVPEWDSVSKFRDSIEQGSTPAPSDWPTPFLTTPLAPQFWPHHADFLMEIRFGLVEAPSRNVDLFITMIMQRCGLSCRNIEDYTRCGLHIFLARMTGHKGWTSFSNDCLHRLADGKPLILAGVLVLHKDRNGVDLLSPLTYQWETDEGVLNLHAQATEICKNYFQIHLDRCEIHKQTSVLLNAMISHLVAVARESNKLLRPRVWSLTVLIGDAMNEANIASQQEEEEVVGSLSSVGFH